METAMNPIEVNDELIRIIIRLDRLEHDHHGIRNSESAISDIRHIRECVEKLKKKVSLSAT